MKWAVLVCLATPIGILVGSGIAALVPSVMDSLNNGGAHGFSEMLYAYSSAGGNNGSAFAGFNANTVFLNVSIGLVCKISARCRYAGHCRKSGTKEENRRNCWYTVYYKCHVRIPVDFCCAADRRTQLFPGAGAWPAC